MTTARMPENQRTDQDTRPVPADTPPTASNRPPWLHLTADLPAEAPVRGGAAIDG